MIERIGQELHNTRLELIHAISQGDYAARFILADLYEEAGMTEWAAFWRGVDPYSIDRRPLLDFLVARGYLTPFFQRTKES